MKLIVVRCNPLLALGVSELLLLANSATVETCSVPNAMSNGQAANASMGVDSLNADAWLSRAAPENGSLATIKSDNWIASGEFCAGVASTAGIVARHSNDPREDWHLRDCQGVSQTRLQ